MSKTKMHIDRDKVPASCTLQSFLVFLAPWLRQRTCNGRGMSSMQWPLWSLALPCTKGPVVEIRLVLVLWALAFLQCHLHVYGEEETCSTSKYKRKVFLCCPQFSLPSTVFLFLCGDLCQWVRPSAIFRGMNILCCLCPPPATLSFFFLPC